MRKLIAAAVMFGTAGLFVPAIARAHFNLMAPASWANQSTQGDPQKSAPCGQADQGTPAVATNMVTAFATGATVTVTLRETVAHPGHFRVALSTTGMAGLPADPAVTAVGTDQCGSTVIQNPPVFPIARGRHAQAHERSQRESDVHLRATRRHDLHGQLRGAGDPVHVDARGALLLSPLREHHDRGGRRHGGHEWNGRCGWPRRRGW